MTTGIRVFNSMCWPGTTADCSGQLVSNFQDLTNSKGIRMDMWRKLLKIV